MHRRCARFVAGPRVGIPLRIFSQLSGPAGRGLEFPRPCAARSLDHHSDSTKLHAWWVPHEQAKFTFLVFHGHAGNIADRAPLYEFLRDTPANALAVEYRGYGRSEGSPSESGVY
jgi:hypothetical protein